jgi:excisionase family DNA binding protein
MNKKEAAAALGITTRTLERHMSGGRIAYAMRKGKTGEEAYFDAAEVARFSAELQGITHAPVVVSGEATTSPDQPRQPDGASPSQALERAGGEQGIAMFASLVADALQGSQAPKMLLNLTDAAEVSGLSANHLLKAIHSKLLDGRKIGRGFKIRPADLHEYAKRVWASTPPYEKREVKQLGDVVKYGKRRG